MVTLKFLRNWARENGVIGFSRMRKDELLELWEESQPEEPRKIYYSREMKKKKKGFVDILKEKSMASLERLKKKVFTLKSSLKMFYQKMSHMSLKIQQKKQLTF